MSDSIVTAIKNRIIEHGRGWCFTPKHFLDLDSDTGVRSALSRLQKTEMIRRLSQGLYDYPREHQVLGLLPPKAEEVAKAIAEKNGIQAQPTGAYAANLIGLSEQVPGRIVFLTNGPSKKITIGNQEICFRTTTEKNMYASGTEKDFWVSIGRDGKIFCNFLPAVSRNALTKMKRAVRAWRLKWCCEKSLEDLSKMFNPIARGWIQYYGKYYKSALFSLAEQINRHLGRWVANKYKNFRRKQRRAMHALGKIARKNTNLFAHWSVLGYLPADGTRRAV